MSSFRRTRAVARPYDRREVLFNGAAAIVSSGLLKGRDVLVLPGDGTIGEIPSNTAEYNANTLIAAPMTASKLELGSIRLVGTAFAGRDPA